MDKTKNEKLNNVTIENGFLKTVLIGIASGLITGSVLGVGHELLTNPESPVRIGLMVANGFINSLISK